LGWYADAGADADMDVMFSVVSQELALSEIALSSIKGFN
jgi:hypothetical protein